MRKANELAAAILEAVGMDNKYCTSLEIKFSVDDLPIVKAEFYLDIDKGEEKIIRVMQLSDKQEV